MTERTIQITQTYTPGKSLGRTRTITVEGIPAIEVTYDGGISTHITFAVSERIDVLIDAAFASNDHADQRISYTLGEPGAPDRKPRAASVRNRLRMSRDDAVR